MRARSLAALLLLACVVAVTSAVGAEGSTKHRRHSVLLKNIAFSPQKLTIRRGDSVTFSWRDGDTNHDVTSTGRLRFKGASTRGSGTYKVAFKKPGLYRYHCTLHLGMTGTVRVK